ncbi:hypothetical protein BDV12DRAFT_195266 [Aspergillus spectabilis]
MDPSLQFKDLPEPSDPAFQSTVNFSPPSWREEKAHKTLPRSRNCTKDLKRQAPYVSFGDGSITATSGAFGSILRISQCVDRADFASRMVALDYEDGPPYHIGARADDLVRRTQPEGNGFGIRVSRTEPLGDGGPFQFFQKLEHGQRSLGQDPLMFGKLKPSGRPLRLVNIYIGFRIVGDFFDRYWTCHFIDHVIDDDQGKTPPKADIYGEGSDWQQRKVLELVLLSRILEKVCASLEDILGEVEGTPNEKQNSVFESAYDSLEDRSSENLQEWERILLDLKKGLISLREVIDQWDMRESSQGREREQKYRKSIKQKRAAAIRSKKSLREAENITLFTYVTVSFLPAGLAVSIFSMNGIPSHTVVGWMALTAAVALVVTLSMLYGVIHNFDVIRGIWHTVKPSSREQRAILRGFPDESLERSEDNHVSTRWSRRMLLLMIRLNAQKAEDCEATKQV